MNTRYGHKTFFFISLFAITLFSCGISKSLKDRPDLSSYNTKINYKRTKINDTTFCINNSQLRKNKQGLWELYTGGDPLERGFLAGSLTRELVQQQEHLFFEKVEEFVPSKTQQYFLRQFLAWFNRKVYRHISNEYKAEIYGVSRFSGNRYDYLADDYIRSLYLHGAHDIGHALKDLALVGCSSFAVWGEQTPDGNLLIARNFDFYAGDEFAKNKIISFVNPKQGYKYISVTWGGMTGVVSGMNEQGLTVTINAGKSKIPFTAKTPIALVTKEILQYAATLQEAVEIAQRKKVFVAESILVGSAKDNRAISIEISPNKLGVFQVENTSQLLCSNHFQSDVYKNDKRNNKQIQESHSVYRYQRMEELLTEKQKITPLIAVDILRNKEGLENTNIGYGNEKALNQLIAHHGIVFQPHDLKVWISTNPYQLGAFVCYDLNTAFQKFEEQDYLQPIQETADLIPKDTFLLTQAYRNYESYRKLRKTILSKINHKENIAENQLLELKLLNSHYWECYFLVGKYYYQKGYYNLALKEFKESLNKEITTIPQRKIVEKYIKKTKKRIR